METQKERKPGDRVEFDLGGSFAGVWIVRDVDMLRDEIVLRQGDQEARVRVGEVPLRSLR